MMPHTSSMRMANRTSQRAAPLPLSAPRAPYPLMIANPPATVPPAQDSTLRVPPRAGPRRPLWENRTCEHGGPSAWITLNPHRYDREERRSLARFHRALATPGLQTMGADQKIT